MKLKEYLTCIARLSYCFHRNNMYNIGYLTQCNAVHCLSRQTFSEYCYNCSVALFCVFFLCLLFLMGSTAKMLINNCVFIMRIYWCWWAKENKYTLCFYRKIFWIFFYAKRSRKKRVYGIYVWISRNIRVERTKSMSLNETNFHFFLVLWSFLFI